MNNVRLNKTIKITFFRCMLVWAIGTILTRLAVCTWGTYILFLEGNLNLIYAQITELTKYKFYRYNCCQSIDINLNFKVQSASPTSNSTTTTPRPVVDNEGGFIVPIWLLWTVIIIYWLFLFLFCCCRMSQRDHRYTGNTEGECILFSIECCECMVQCCEDLGKGQISDANGGINDVYFWYFILVDIIIIRYKPYLKSSKHLYLIFRSRELLWK